MTDLRPAILVVDDDKIDRETAERYLRKEYQPILAGTGGEALACLQKQPLACILLDLGLPDYDGREIIESLSKHAPVIVLTGQGDESAAVEAMKLGAADYLVKDKIDRDSLSRAASGAIERRRLERTIQDQQRKLLEDERLKVLIQLAGSSLVDLNGPITRLSLLMERFSQDESRSPDDKELLERAFRALSEITATMRRIQYLRLEEAASGNVQPVEFDQTDEAPTILCAASKTEDLTKLTSALKDLAGEVFVGDVVVASSVEEIEKRFEAIQVDVVITGNQFPDGSALDILRLTSKSDEVIPVIVVADYGDGAMVANVLRAGASDYLDGATFSSADLKPTLKRTLDRAALTLGLQKSQERMHALAFTDDLTQIYNRRFLTESMSRELNRIARHKGHVAFCLIDLDRFKVLNDHYGHAAGDHALRETAKVLIESIRKTDLAARYGGEEFGVFLPDADVTSAKTVAENIRANLEKAEIVFEGKRLPVTASIGVALMDDGDMGTVADLIAAADAGLYRAKDEGRNRIVFNPEVVSPTP